jgi:hypothetical protein
LLNSKFINRRDLIFLTIAFLGAIIISFLGGNRMYVVRLLFYIPVIFILTILKNRINKGWLIFVQLFIVIISVFLIILVYNGNISNYFSGDIKSKVSEFEESGFSNTREQDVYPTFLADMRTKEDWILGRGHKWKLSW